MTAFIPSLLNAALVKITLLVMIGCSALTALTKTAMAFLIDQVITAYPTIETTRSSHTLFFHHPTNLNHCTYAFMRLIGISLHPYVFACMQLFDFLYFVYSLLCCARNRNSIKLVILSKLVCNPCYKFHTQLNKYSARALFGKSLFTNRFTDTGHTFLL